MFLIGTNVVYELRKVGDDRANANVTTWVSKHDASRFYISAITLMEIEIGVLRIERRDVEQGNRLWHWMERHLMPEFRHRTLSVDVKVALKCAQLHVPYTRSERDALIAATAIVDGMTVVTRNTVESAAIGVAIINPWTES